MFNKIHYTFYEKMFEFYGKLAKHYWNKAMKEKALNPGSDKWLKYEQKAWKYIDAREDILEIEFALKGLI
jgi:hypothetical protein